MKKSDVFRLARGAARLYYNVNNTDQIPKTIDFILWLGENQHKTMEVCSNYGNGGNRNISPKLIKWLFLLNLSSISRAKECPKTTRNYRNIWDSVTLKDRISEYLEEKRTPKRRIVHKKILKYNEE
jgi:hypothetical protein